MSGSDEEKKLKRLRDGLHHYREKKKREAQSLADRIDMRGPVPSDSQVRPLDSNVRKMEAPSGTGYESSLAAPVDEINFKPMESPGSPEGTSFEHDPFRPTDATTGPGAPGINNNTQSAGDPFNPGGSPPSGPSGPLGGIFGDAPSSPTGTPLGDVDQADMERFRDKENPFFDRLGGILNEESIDAAVRLVNQKYGTNLPVNELKEVIPKILPFFSKHANRVFGGDNPEKFHTYSSDASRIAELVEDAMPIISSIMRVMYQNGEMNGQLSEDDLAKLDMVRNEVTDTGTSDFLKGGGGVQSGQDVSMVDVPVQDMSQGQQQRGGSLADMFSENPFLQEENVSNYQSPQQTAYDSPQQQAPRQPAQRPPQKKSAIPTMAELMAEHKAKFGGEEDFEAEMAQVEARDRELRGGVDLKQQMEAELSAQKTVENDLRPPTAASEAVDRAVTEPAPKKTPQRRPNIEYQPPRQPMEGPQPQKARQGPVPQPSRPPKQKKGGGKPSKDGVKAEYEELYKKSGPSAASDGRDASPEFQELFKRKDALTKAKERSLADEFMNKD